MPKEQPKPLFEHLSELRYRVLWILGVFVAVFTLSFFTPSFFNSWATLTIQYLSRRFLPSGTQLVFLNPLEPLLASFKISLFISLAVICPYLFYHLYAFMAPALSKNQKRFTLWLGAGSMFFLVLGILFTYYLLIPITLYIFLNYGASMNAVPKITLQEFCSFLFIMFLIFSLPFELPMVMGLLSFLHLVRPQTFRDKRKIAYLIAAIFSAIITPDPTPVSMTILMICLWILYEVGIWFGRVLTATSQPKGSTPGKNKKSLYP